MVFFFLTSLFAIHFPHYSSSTLFRMWKNFAASYIRFSQCEENSGQENHEVLFETTDFIIEIRLQGLIVISIVPSYGNMFGKREGNTMVKHD